MHGCPPCDTLRKEEDNKNQIHNDATFQIILNSIHQSFRLSLPIGAADHNWVTAQEQATNVQAIT